MKLVAGLVLVLFWSGALFGQGTVGKGCPTVSVGSTAGAYRPGAVELYTATIRENVSGRELRYTRTAWNGEIVSGQNSPEARVRTPADGQSLTVSVEIRGLSTDCPKIAASETTAVDPAPQAVLVDEFSRLPWNPRRQDLALIADRLKVGSPDRAGLVLNIRSGREYLAAVIHADSVFARLRRLDSSLGDEKTLIAISITGSRSMMLAKIPAGTERPYCGTKCEWLAPADLSRKLAASRAVK